MSEYPKIRFVASEQAAHIIQFNDELEEWHWCVTFCGHEVENNEAIGVIYSEFVVSEICAECFEACGRQTRSLSLQV